MLIRYKQLNFSSELPSHCRQFNFGNEFQSHYRTHKSATNVNSLQTTQFRQRITNSLQTIQFWNTQFGRQLNFSSNYKFVADHTTSAGNQRMLIHCRQLSFDSESKFCCRQYNFVSESQIHYRTHNSAANANSL
jgi:hypothetical protein